MLRWCGRVCLVIVKEISADATTKVIAPCMLFVYVSDLGRVLFDQDWLVCGYCTLQRMGKGHRVRRKFEDS